MLNMRKKALVIALGLAGIAGTAQAALQAVDPGPYTAATGYFPLYYSDTTPTTLDLCLSKAASANGAMCVLLPNPGIFDPAEPILFPFNFPDESFWFTADASIVAGGVDLSYGAAIEAAFGGGVPAAGDQISFARIRIRADVSAPGTYTVTHPYGVETFVVTTVDAGREINMTRDIGIGAPGVFTGALAGDIGPFLQSVNGPYTVGTETFIGDPNILEPVTGGPFGNVVSIEGPTGTLTTDQFAVSGRIWGGQRPTDVAVERSTYRRAFNPDFTVNTAFDVFANTPASITASAEYQRGIATLPVPMTADAGNFYIQDTSQPDVLPPPYVIVTATDATAAVPTTPTSLASALNDVVTVSRAVYAQDSQTLIIEAASSDQVTIPTLGVVGFPTPMSVIPGTANAQRLEVSPVLDPPAEVTVFSAFGGRDVEPVVVVDTAPVNQPPAAVADSATTLEDTPVTISVLANDTDPDGGTLAVTSVFGATNGTATTNGSTVTFTPAANFNGTGSVNYTITDGQGGLASALVTVAVAPVNDAPRITSAPGTVASVGVPYSYDVNATDPDVGDLLTYSLVAPPTGMTINAATGLIAWTPAAAGNVTVIVQVTDNGTPALSATQTFTIAVAGAIDYDIVNFNVNGVLRVGRVATPVMRFRNAATGQQLRTATLIGTRLEVGVDTEVYNRSLQISVAPGTATNVTFPSYRFVAADATKTIRWRVEIFDDNPDIDTSTVRTRVTR